MRNRCSVVLFTTLILGAISAYQSQIIYAADNLKLNSSQEISQRTQENIVEIINNEEVYKGEIAKLKEQVMNLPTDNIEKFKIQVDKAIVQMTSKSLPLLGATEKEDFNYRMTEFRNKLNAEQGLVVEKAKNDFAYEADQVMKLISGKKDKEIVKSNVKVDKKDLDLETYNKLVQEIGKIGEKSLDTEKKFNLGGEIRYHSSANRGTGRLDEDQSGLRTRIGIDAYLAKDWRAYGMVELKNDLHNYDNIEEFNRFYVKGKIKDTLVTAGAFGYLMGEGNIYDSRFDGLKLEFGERIKYAVAYGETNSSKDTLVTTAKYLALDYDLEVGLYTYRMQDTERKNTLANLAYNYYFSNFSLGAMYLNAKMEDRRGDSDGYVFGINYGKLKTFRPKTYDIFAKYYDQAQGTYIAHGMNGIGVRMQGFKGCAVGAHQTLIENVVVGVEYYNLEDKITGSKGKTLWGSVTYYF